MRILIAFAFLSCLILPARAFCGPSVGGGDGSIVEEGQVPETACAVSGSLVTDGTNREPHGGDMQDMGSSDAAGSSAACVSSTGDL